MFHWIKKLFKSTPTQPIVNRVRLGAELFEARTLPSVSLSLSALTHKLTISAPTGPDQVQASTVNHDIKLDINGHNFLYTNKQVSQIVVDVGKGSDKVVNDTKLQMTVNEGQDKSVVVGGTGLIVQEGGTGVSASSGSSAGDLLTASLTGTTGATGVITVLPSETNLSVVVAGLTASSTYTVDIGTTSVGTFTTDANGAANVILDNISATVNAGTTASILDSNENSELSGTFAIPTANPIPPGSGGGICSPPLAAGLTGSTSGLMGEVAVLPSQTTGDVNLMVMASGLTANSTYTLDIAGTSVGTFTTDSNGNANTTFTNISATIASGTAATIVDSNGNTDLSGTFVTSITPPPFSGTGPGGSIGTPPLGASLTGSSSGVVGHVTVLPSLTSGDVSLQVMVSGLMANSTYTLDIAGTSVGTFTTDSNGNANTTLTNISATIASGTAATIVDSNGNTDLSGTFATITAPPPPFGPPPPFVPGGGKSM